MRSSHKNRNRSRHRSGGSSGGGGGGGGNPLSRVYESNGPDVKVRGNAQTIADKYLQLGRDAQSSGDIVMAESYFQHAEHYLRIVFAAQAYNQQAQQQYRRPDEDFDDDDIDDAGEASVELRGGQQASAEPEGLGDQPPMDSGPERERQPQHNQGNRQPRDNRDRDYNRDQNRDQANQPREGRDRFRPRWQDRRGDGQQGEPRQNAAPPPRFEEQPRREAPATPQASDAGEADHWEAPSFLRRPAPAPAPAPAVEAAAPADEAAAPAPKRKYERRPRKEAATETPAADEAKAD
jgi:hypothetical protein